MAKKVTVTLVDDTDGSTPAEETIGFELDSVEYTIDLSKANAAKLRKVFAPWVDKATRVSGRKTSKPRKQKQSVGDLAEAREWAKSKGYAVASKGQLKREILEEFRSQAKR